jgi:hypothetical protein
MADPAWPIMENLAVPSFVEHGFDQHVPEANTKQIWEEEIEHIVQTFPTVQLEKVTPFFWITKFNG